MPSTRCPNCGNRNDVKTWQEIVTTMEARYGKADRIWCGDRGMMSQANIEFMESENRRYIIGASKSTKKDVIDCRIGRIMAQNSRAAKLFEVEVKQLGDEPRRIFDELGEISLVDVVLPTRKGPEIRRRCVRWPTDHHVATERQPCHSGTQTLAPWRGSAIANRTARLEISE